VLDGIVARMRQGKYNSRQDGRAKHFAEKGRGCCHRRRIVLQTPAPTQSLPPTTAQYCASLRIR
jgi:hypothetical protein